MIVLSVLIPSLWLASNAFESSTLHVTFWSVTCGMLLSGALHKMWTFFQGQDSLQSTESQTLALPDMKKRLETSVV